MTFAHLNRRVHLYAGLALLPWFLMYAISSIPFAHTPFFEARDAARKLPMWTLRMDRTIDVHVPPPDAGPAELRRFGRALLTAAGIAGTSFGVYRQSDSQVNVYSYSFWRSTQVKYFVPEKRITVEDRRFRWDQFLTGMHARGGFEDERLLNRSWSVVVDLVCVAMLLWIGSGLYMWWGLPGHRRWGIGVIGAGAASFLIFVFAL
jgi:hypothetical protein